MSNVKVKMGSAADHQPLDQRFRKTGLTHAFLDGRDIVGHAPEFHRLVLEIRDRKSGAGIAIAGLPDRARIQKITARQFNAQRGKRFGWARMNLKNFKLRLLIRKAALVMRVTEESDFRSGIQEPVKRLRGREHIFIFVLKRTVNEYNAVGGERARRKPREPGQVFGFKLKMNTCSRPRRRLTGSWI